MSDQSAQPAPKVIEPSQTAEEVSTVRPPFDVAEFARDSDSRIRVEALPPSARPTTPPADASDEPARDASGTMQSLGSLTPDAVPTLAVAREDLEWFDVPPYPRALLRYVDGRQSISAICARACYKVDEAMGAFHQLARDGIVTLKR
jgi:hypothetical protein